MPKQFADLTNSKQLVQIEFINPKAKKKVNNKQGCEYCPLDKVKGIKKIKGLTRIKGKKIFVWCQNPGKKENEEGLELVGPTGKFIWDALKPLGIAREDVDVQNVVRCATLVYDEDTENYKDRTPLKEEVKCCSKYNARALELNGGKARVHLIFGQIAAKVLLGREYRKDNPIFWSDKLKGKVVCLDHPSYFLHGAPRYRLEQFHERLRTALLFVKHAGKYSILKKQNYELLYRAKEVKEYFQYIKKYALRKKRSVVVDIETGYTYKDWSSEKLKEKEVHSKTEGAVKVALVLGFCHAPGSSRTIVLDHPDSKISIKERNKVKKLIVNFLKDKSIEKVMHFGCSDFNEIEALLDTKIKNYWFDTNHSTYLLWPQLKSYGLNNLSNSKLPEFSGYKDIIKEYLVPERHNFATIPLKIHKLYNGGDCDVTKRLELLTRSPLLKRSPNSKPLLRTYRHVDFTLRDMQTRGPFLDRLYARKFRRAVIRKIKIKARKMREIVKDKEFNPRSQPQVKDALYTKLDLPVITFKRVSGSTAANTLKILWEQTKSPFIKNLQDYRSLQTMLRNHLKNYFESANLFDGQLRTKWWLTGGITGRLRSGGKEDGIVNFQNFNKKPAMKNLLVSDPEWRQAIVEYKRRDEIKYKHKLLNREVFLIADYSQIELRIIAILAKCKALLKIFNTPGEDAHALIGARFTRWSYEVIQTDEAIRTLVKNINFGLPFGLSEQSFFESLLARGSKVTRKESDELYKAYFRTYPELLEFQSECRTFAEKNDYVETLFGFRRPIILEGDEDRGTFWGNQAINSRVQGSAHQLLLFAMALLRTQKKRFHLLVVKPVLEIHDALAFYIKVKDIPEANTQLKDLLEVAVVEYIAKNFKYKMPIPIECEIKGGFRMGAMTKYKGQKPLEFVQDWIATNKEVNAKVYKEWKVAA